MSDDAGDEGNDAARGRGSTVQPTALQTRAQAALNGDPDEPAISDGTGWYNWGWLRDTGARVATLLDTAHVPRDRPVGLVGRNRPAIVAALIALIADGRSIRMLYAFQSMRMLAQALNDGELSAVVAVDEDFSTMVAEAAAAARICAVSVHEELGVGLVNDLTEGPRVLPAADPPVAMPFIEVLTSGTTGPPRQFQLTHDTIAKSLRVMNVNYQPVPSAAQGAAQLSYYPLSTIAGLHNLLPPALDRRPMILQEKFELDGWLEFVRRYRPARASLPPAGIEMLLSRDLPPDALGGLVHIGTGAAPVDAAMQVAFEERFGVTLLVSYGATEFGGPVAAMTVPLREEWGTRKRGSVGRAWGGARLRVVDPDTGEEVAPGVEGAIEVVSPAIGPDWIRSTDLGSIDADGFLFHHGRADGAISRGGFAILPGIIERALVSHPQVAAASVIGLSHRRLGEVPVAAIQPKDIAHPPDLGELERHVRDHVFATHVPVQYRIVKQLPRNHALKVDLARVRALFERPDAT